MTRCVLRMDRKGPEAQAAVASAMHPNSDRDRILEATDLVGLIGEQVRLEPKGSEFIGLCPFHDDARPSMYVVPAKRFYHCFACGAHGNAIDFLINLHNLEFREALEALANRAGLELSRQTASSRQASDRRKQLFRANQLATRFFARTLTESTHVHSLCIDTFLLRTSFKRYSTTIFSTGSSFSQWNDSSELIPSVSYAKTVGHIKLRS